MSSAKGATKERTLVNPQSKLLPPKYKTNHLMGALPEMGAGSLALFEKVRSQVGNIAQVRFGPKWVYFVADPGMIEQILIKDVGKYEKQTRGYEKLRLLLGNGLVTSEGDFWRRQRRIAQPGFRRERIEGFVETMGRATEDMAQAWDKVAAEGGQLDVSQEMMKLTLRIAGETLFSADISKGSDDFGGALSFALEHFNFLVSSPVPYPEYWPLRGNLKFWRSVKLMQSFVWSLIEKRRASGEDHGDLLSMLMLARDEETGEGMSDRQLLDEVFTMLSAGHETTANAMTWSLYLLSQHPEVATRVAEESQALLGDRAPTAAELKSLPYTEQVFKEAIRLYPPIWALARKAGEDLQLGDYHVPKGKFVFFGQHTMHRHPELWKEPERFDPDRFGPEGMDELKAKPHWRHIYFPFSQGQRKCIGDHFAMMEGVALLSVLARRYEFGLAPGAKVVPEASLTLRPKFGMPLVLTPRK